MTQTLNQLPKTGLIRSKWAACARRPAAVGCGSAAMRTAAAGGRCGRPSRPRTAPHAPGCYAGCCSPGQGAVCAEPAPHPNA